MYRMPVNAAISANGEAITAAQKWMRQNRLLRRVNIEDCTVLQSLLESFILFLSIALKIASSYLYAPTYRSNFSSAMTVRWV